MSTLGTDERSGPRDRVAAIDCGTNSIRMLIAEADSAGGLVDLDRRLEIVRLGQGIDATGEFHPDALARTFGAVERYAKILEAAGVASDRIHFVATSAARDAGNRVDFFEGVHRRLGILPEVISGEREAQLSFRGAISRIRPAAEPVLVMDIGGGSTELIIGSASGEIHQAVSLDIGSVRLTERFLRTSPPAGADLSRATDAVDERLAASRLNLGVVGFWIGVAGTVTTMAAVHLGLQTYERKRVHGAAMASREIADLLTRLSVLSVPQIRAIPTMHPQRADVITAGTLIAARVAAGTAASELVVSESDILDGIALALLRGEKMPR
jgi:exopolyphosphatase/guanosine-5'-triphosphate,3'-diphosphate pyrophosphatase